MCSKEMKYYFCFLLFGILFISAGRSQTNVSAKNLNLKNGLAIEGYDPVAYFTQNKAVKGNPKYNVSIGVVRYHFSNQKNKELFQKDRDKYLPQYGGWCAYAMGENGDKIEIDPTTFKIRNRKLYLFYHTWAVNTLNKWNQNESQLNRRADANWLKMNH